MKMDMAENGDSEEFRQNVEKSQEIKIVICELVYFVSEGLCTGQA